MNRENLNKFLESLNCPICGEIFESPFVSTSCGHIFCKDCIQNEVALNQRCPVCFIPAQPKDLTRIIMIEQIVEEIQKVRISGKDLLEAFEEGTNENPLESKPEPESVKNMDHMDCDDNTNLDIEQTKPGVSFSFEDQSTMPPPTQNIKDESVMEGVCFTTNNKVTDGLLGEMSSDGNKVCISDLGIQSQWAPEDERTMSVSQPLFADVYDDDEYGLNENRQNKRRTKRRRSSLKLNKLQLKKENGKERQLLEKENKNDNNNDCLDEDSLKIDEEIIGNTPSNPAISLLSSEFKSKSKTNDDPDTSNKKSKKLIAKKRKSKKQEDVSINGFLQNMRESVNNNKEKSKGGLIARMKEDEEMNKKILKSKMKKPSKQSKVQPLTLDSRTTSATGVLPFGSYSMNQIETSMETTLPPTNVLEKNEEDFQAEENMDFEITKTSSKSSSSSRKRQREEIESLGDDDDDDKALKNNVNHMTSNEEVVTSLEISKPRRQRKRRSLETNFSRGVLLPPTPMKRQSICPSTTKSEVSNKIIKVVASGLTNIQFEKLQYLVVRFGGRLEIHETVTNDIAYVITNTDTKGRCKRTAKYLNGVALGKWILSQRWIRDCDSSGKLLPPNKYEIKGDKQSLGAARKSRLAHESIEESCNI
eukprot:TRINITY_DN4222_c1_g2_i2.p1 TRINITY_DN4222_c1_g2~~TRINITY_DN4222_c1_g2_i2.p1  ORF type:complete len:646 (+),score=171.00 TRINITY_DN4222_c1_g2_i2:450-2387(+)